MTIYQTQLEAAIEAVSKIKIREIYLVACGGSKAEMDAPQYILDKECEIPSFVLNSNEFIHRSPKALGANSLVITCSHSGNTPETVKATEFANAKGAITVAFSHLVDSPLWNVAQCPILYMWGPEAVPENHKTPMVYRFIFGLLDKWQPNKKYKNALNVVHNIGNILDSNQKKFTERANEYGERVKREKIIYTMASGPNYGIAYSFSICLLMEMLWKNSNAIHSGEYFHGPFEITDFDVPFLLIKGYGSTRPLDERAEKFIPRFSKKMEVLDSNEFEWGLIEEDLKEYFCPVIASSILRKYAEGIAYSTGHPLSVRRYMWILDY